MISISEKARDIIGRNVIGGVPKADDLLARLGRAGLVVVNVNLTRHLSRFGPSYTGGGRP